MVGRLVRPRSGTTGRSYVTDRRDLKRSEARRAVKEGSAYLNNVKVSDEAQLPVEADWLHGCFLVLRRGKRSLAVVQRER